MRFLARPASQPWRLFVRIILLYVSQLESLYAELDSLSNREESLRDFRATGSAAEVTIGLQFGAPCEGITTDNAIQQLAIRRQEIEQQISDLQETAEQNGMPPAVIQDPSAILQAARKPLSPGQERAVLIERQSDLMSATVYVNCTRERATATASVLVR